MQGTLAWSYDSSSPPGSGSGSQRQWDGTICCSVSGRAPLPVPPWRHLFPTGKASRSQGTPGQAWTGPFPSGYSWSAGLWGADPLDPSSPLSLAHCTRGMQYWQTP